MNTRKVALTMSSFLLIIAGLMTFVWQNMSVLAQGISETKDSQTTSHKVVVFLPLIINNNDTSKSDKSDVALRLIANKILQEQLNPELTNLLYNALNDSQRVIITKHIAEFTGVTLSEIEQERSESAKLQPTVVDKSDESLRQIAGKIRQEQMSPELTQLFYDAFNTYQKDAVTQHLAKFVGVDFNEVKKEIEENNKSQKQPRGPGYNVQMIYGTGSPSVSISSYISNPMCDSDPNDDDWVFFANTPQNVSPSKMRWYSSSSVVTWALNTAYNGLSTYGSHSTQINVCLGTRGTLLAGGASNVKNNLKVKYK